jgi:hypothetical protein
MAQLRPRPENDERMGVTAAAAGAAVRVIPLPAPRWWCTTCGRLEADEQPDPDCVYTQIAGHGRVATRGPGGVPLADGLDRGLDGIVAAQYLLVEAQLRTERLLDDDVDMGIQRALSGTAEILHELGAQLLAAHSALSCARLAAPEGR